MIFKYVKNNSSFLFCILLLVIYFFLYFHTIPVIGLCLFLCSLFLGVHIISKRSGNFLINNSELFLLVCIFLYGFYNPVMAYLSDNMNIAVYKAMIIYATAVPAYLIGLHGYNDKLTEFKSLTINHKLFYFFIILLVILIAYKSYFFYSIDLFFNPLNLAGKGRDYIFGSMNQMDVIIGILITGIFLFLIYYYKNLSKIMLFSVATLLLYYILLNIFAGNRRDFIPMLLGVFYMIINRYNIKFSWKWLVTIVIVASLFNIMGGVRSMLSNKIAFNKDIVVSSLKNNEFTIPFNTLIDEVALYEKNADAYNFKKGETYIKNTFEIFIPRKLFPNKFTSLAKEYMVKFHNTTNYAIAYTPVTESFINFGKYGAAFVYIVIGLLMGFLTNYKNQIFIFAFFCLTIDFCRSEYSGFVYNYVLVLFPFIVSFVLNKFKIA